MDYKDNNGESLKLTPMLAQYMSFKRENEGSILLFRLGDFYEMFFEDAITASRELGIALTKRGSKAGEGAPMCGVPFHSAQTYIARLVKSGYNVAICEQTGEEDPETKLFKREIVKIITPGTLIEEDLLDDSKNNYIMAIFYASRSGDNIAKAAALGNIKPNGGVKIGIALSDITTGEVLTAELKEERDLIDKIARFRPSEIIVLESFPLKKELSDIFNVKPQVVPDWYFSYDTSYNLICEWYSIKSLHPFGLEELTNATRALGSLFEYIKMTQRDKVHLNAVKMIKQQDIMHLDISSRTNLELIENMKGNKKGSLLSILDDTKTPMGARLLSKWLQDPLLQKREIEIRNNHVELYYTDDILRHETRTLLEDIRDIERILARIKNNPLQNINALKFSLRAIQNLNSPIFLDKLEDILAHIENHINDSSELKKGINQELDEASEAKENGNAWLLELESREIEKTGIKKLRIKHSKLFGYTFEVSNSYKSEVPDYFIRKQTLTNTERYQTEELIEIAEKIFSAESKIEEITKLIIASLVSYIALNAERILSTAKRVAYIDVTSSFAVVAINNNYVKPILKESISGTVSSVIKGGRHPVVEKFLENSFIPNDASFNEDTRVYCITGPNMSGKSTFMRSVALIHLMAQIGSYVPCEHAELVLVDRIFTRVGASDDLATGQSTFMVEMNEVSNILTNATKNSLIILDEIGRGTSTYDGLSIAWSVLEYIAKLGAKTLFATHYHELSQIEETVKGVKNYCVTIEEIDGSPIFLHKIVRGAAKQSYGITVAKLAGLPESVISRAEKIMNSLSTKEDN
ncbi:MAG: DNA mismatch repair protein MutS [Defluviitaleaceae bacterium]|nr:DNA mismatch repair protein MutS [Defluviitaleaceae bacterium]